MELAASSAPQISDVGSIMRRGGSSCAHEPAAPAAGNSAFWKNYPGLVWSNRQADDGVRIRAALMKPRFDVLLAIAVKFGLERLEREWADLRADPETKTGRVERMVIPILANIRRGYEQACA